jgi:hypothetical protein
MSELDWAAKAVGILCWVVAGICAYFIFNLTFWQSVAIGLLVGYMGGFGIAVLGLLIRIAQRLGINDD